VMIVGVNVSDCFWYPAHPGYAGFNGCKMVVVVVVFV